MNDDCLTRWTGIFSQFLGNQLLSSMFCRDDFMGKPPNYVCLIQGALCRVPPVILWLWYSLFFYLHVIIVPVSLFDQVFMIVMNE
jgi:hypothetical protein